MAARDGARAATFGWHHRLRAARVVLAAAQRHLVRPHVQPLEMNSYSGCVTRRRRRLPGDSITGVEMSKRLSGRPARAPDGQLAPTCYTCIHYWRVEGIPMRAWIMSTGLVMAISSAVAQTPQPGWIADARTGCRVWNHHPEAKEMITWSGRCENGRAQGSGVVQWFADGRLYERIEGEMRDGRVNGYAIVTTWVNGPRYGDVMDDKGTGHDVEAWPRGSRYEGGFVNGAANGAGVLVDSNGVTYNGEWTNGCFRDGKRWAAVGADPSTCH